ncbi:MAG: matrixin family metalloprotease [Sandaracinaceae bacterium]
MNRPNGIAGLATLLVLGSASSALAWQPIAGGSPTWRPPVPYSLHEAGSPDLGGFAGTEAEVRRGMDDWTLVACTSLTTSYQGSTSRRPGTYEGTSTIGWTESGWPHSGSAIGVTGPRWSSSIIEADMEMNGVNFVWTTGSGSGGNPNAYSIILHEGGHYYGLGHTNVRGSSMWPSYSGGIVGLGSDDQNGICALYPGSGTPTDCTTTGCPSGQECISGACQTVTGDGSICAVCTSGADCAGPGAACLGYPDGVGYCGQGCSSDGDCAGDTCVNTSAGGQCVRVVGSSISCAGASPSGCTRDSDCGATELCSGGSCQPRPTDGAGLGEACDVDEDCQTSFCIGGLCTQTCDWTDPAGSCPGGFYCDADPTSCTDGFCVAGGAGGGANGAACSADTECASLLCDEGTCAEPCIPGGAASCPAGFACQVGSLPCRGSCRVSGALGDECNVNGDCTSGLCADRGESDFCTSLCNADNACPDNFTCTPVGDASICVPNAGGLGADCTGNDDCLSNICAVDGSDSYCTRICSDGIPCPGGTFMCVATADGVTSVCQPTDDGGGRDGCGCRTAGAPASSGFGALLGMLGVGLLFWRRRT